MPSLTPLKGAAAAALLLGLSACTVTAPKPIAYRASAAQVQRAIAEIAPGLPTKLLNERFRVVGQTPTSITVATKFPTAAKVAQLLLTGTASFFEPEAQITFNLRPAGNLTYVTYATNSTDLDSRAQETFRQLDRRFGRVALP